MTCTSTGTQAGGIVRADAGRTLMEGRFEGYFERLGALLATGVPTDPEALAAVAAEFSLDIDPASIPDLAATHGLRLG